MAKYSTVLANEFNTIRNTVVAVLNTGTGTRSYGSPVVSAEVAVGQKITPTEFSVLATDINTCYTHIAGTTATSLASVVKGNKITWANIVTYQVAATYIDTNRDTNGGAQTSTSAETILPAPWGRFSGKYSATITGTFTWASAEAMRYFFNQGSRLAMVGGNEAPVSGSNAKTDAFLTMMNNINLTMSPSNYRAGTGVNQVQTTTVAPYSAGTPDSIRVDIFAPSTTTVSFQIQCIDRGNDDGDADAVIVYSDILKDLKFYATTNRVSNTTGITRYDPTVSFGSWTYDTNFLAL